MIAMKKSRVLVATYLESSVWERVHKHSGNSRKNFCKTSTDYGINHISQMGRLSSHNPIQWARSHADP